MERKCSKEYSVVFLVKGEKFKLRNLPSRTSSLLSILLRTRSAQRLSSQHLAAVPTPNIAELVRSGVFFSFHNHGFCGGPNTFSQEKHQHVHVDRHLVTGKESGAGSVSARGVVVYVPASYADDPGSILGGDRNYFFFLFLIFLLFFFLESIFST